MKKIYQNPEIKIVNIQTAQLMTDSMAVGNAYQSGDAVLSRDGGSFWDDDDEY